MKYSNSIEYNISTKFDSSGITKLKNELAQLELKFQSFGNKNQLFNFDEYRTQIQGLGNALTEAFNPSLGIINLQKFKEALKENHVTANGLRQAFQMAGSDGQVAFNNLIGQLGRLDTGIKRTSSAVDKMYVTFQNTFRWGLISSFFSSFMNAIHQSVQYAKDLDDSLTQIMLVTDYSRDSMNEYAKAANEAAKAVGQTTVGMTNASLIFAQQGYDLDQSQQLATLSAKLANASQQDTAATSDQITAYMNAYGLQDSMDELVQAMDNWAKIANISAADVEEIALASQRAASMANAVGVSGEALAAQIATIESVTREAPEQIGNGLKTLYARFSDLKLGKDDEDGIGLGKVTSTLQQIGVQVLDAFGNVRDMDDIMEDLMAVWQDLDDTSKTAAAQALAGKHQVNRFMALMENPDMYQEYLGATGANASGTLEQMNQEYLDSLQGRTAKLQATLEGLFNDVFTTDMVYPLIDALTGLADIFDTLFKSVGGGRTVLLGLVSILTKLFSNNMAQSINDTALNISVQKQREENFKNKEGTLAWLGSVNPNPNNTHSQAILSYAQGINSMAGSFDVEQMNKLNQILQEMVTNANAAEQANNELKTALDGLGIVSNTLFGTGAEPFFEDGIVNVADLTASLNNLKSADGVKSLSNLFNDLQNSKQNLTDFSSGLTDVLNKINQGLNNAEVGDFAEEFDKLELILEHLKGVLPEDQFNKLAVELDSAKNVVKDWDISKLEQTPGVLQNIQSELNDTVVGVEKFVAENKKITPQAIIEYLTEVEKLANKVKAAENAASGSDAVGDGALRTSMNQQQIKSYIDLASAIGQVAFSIQSIKNLQSIWNNDDLTTTEKLLQTFTNLGIVIPSVITALKSASGIKSFEELKSFLSIRDEIKGSSVSELMSEYELSLKNVKDAQKELADVSKEVIRTQQKLYNAVMKWGPEHEKTAKAEAEYTAALEKQRIAEDRLKESDEAATVSSQKLAAAQSAKKLQILAVVAAISILISAISAYNEHLKEIAKNSVEAFNNTFEKTQIDTSNFDELYQKYKETGIASDELKDAGIELSKQLGIVGGSALAASGNFEELANQIRNAKSATDENMARDASIALNDLNANANNAFSNSITVGNAGLGWDQWTESSITEKYGMVLDALEEEKQETAELDNQIAELEAASVSEWDSRLIEAKSARTRSASRRKALEKLLEEDFEGMEEIVNIMADSALSQLSESDFSGLSSTDIMQSLLDPNGDYSWIAEQYRMLGEEDGRAYLAGIMSQLDPKNANLYSLLAGDFSILGDGETSINVTGLTPEMMQQFGYEDYDAFVAALQEKAAQGITLTPEINIESRYDFDSDEEINKYLEDYTDIDRNTLETAASLRYDEYSSEGNRYNGNVDYRRSELNQARQNVMDSVGAGNETELNAQKELIDAQEEYNEALQDTTRDAEDYQKAMRRSAAAAARMVKTLDDMNDHFDDNREILKDGNKSTIEYAEALTQMKEDVAGLLDIDADSLSNDFFETTEALDLMDTMLHGTQEEAEAAYTTLRQLAAQDVINNLDIPVEFTTPDGSQTFSSEYIKSTLSEMINSLDSQDLTIATEADINTEEWYARVNELLASGAITADQLTQVLSAAGYVGQIDKEPGKGYMQEMTYDISTTGFDIPSDPSRLASINGTITMTPKAARSVPVDMEVPVLKGATQKGGFVNNAGGGGGRKSGGGGGSCFAAGTLVSLQNQFKNIEDIQIGDIVLSYNEEIHQNEYSIVLQTMIHDVTEEIYDLYIEDEILTVTGIHRFYVRRKHDIEWIPASDLHIGDYVLFADGNWHPIFKIKIKIRSLLVYNFEVSHNHNYYVGRNQILAHNKGGGGGGGSKAKTVEKKEKKKHEKDYYEEVDSQLDKIKEQLTGIEKQEDKLIGDKARANQAKQIALLNKEITLQERKLDILQKQEIPETKTKLDESIAELGDILSKYGLNLNMPKLEYDEDGIISNFEDISQLITDKYNELVSKQWAIADSADEEANKEIEKAMSNFEKAGDKTKDLIQKLNDLQKTQIEWTNAIQESKDAVEDLNIELYKTSMEAIDNLKDLNEKWAEFQGFLTGMPSDSPFRELTVDLLKLNSTFEISKKDAEEYYQQIIDGKLAAQKATNDQAEKEAIQASINYFTGLRDGLTDDMLKNGLLGLAMADLEQLEKWYRNDPTAGKNPFGENQKELVEAYQEGYERVLELSQDWQDLQEDIVNDVIDGFDEIADKQDRQLEKYERLAEELESLADTYALSYGDESYKALSDIGKRQAETLKAQLGQYVNIYNYWEQQYEAAIDTGNEELINSIEDRMNDVQDEMRDLAQESAEAFVEAYENAMDAAVQDMYQNLFGENNLDHLDRNWEWDKKVIDNYRDEIEKTFEIEQLRSKYNDLLNDAQGSSLATQNKIRKQMQEQLDLLKNQESMSEYDVQLANSKLLILQKQIALEDAQQNKNQMQLRRDSQGNYRYVYRASQNDIAKARQEYMQAVQDAYELTKEQRQKTAEELSNTLKDYANEWRDLSTNMNLTEEQRLNQSKELTTKFLEYMKHLNEDLTDSQLGMSDVLNFMVENGTADVAAAAQQMLGQLFDDQGNLIEDTNIAWWDFGNDLAKKLFPYIEDATSTMNSTLEKEADELREKLTGPDGVIKEVTNAIAGENGLRPALEDATKAIVGENGLDAAMDSLADSLENQNKKLTEGMENIEKYTKGLAAALDWLATAQNAIKDLQDITIGELVSETSAPLPEEAKSEEPKPAVTTTTTTAKPATNTNKLNKDRVLAAYNEIMSGRAGNEDARWRYLTNKGYTNAEQDAAQAVVNAVYGGSGRDAALKRIVGYASGGYTGEWGKDGKLAVLHQKELVLNAEDTRNILSAVDIVRQMTSTLGNALTNYSIGGARNSLMNSGFGTVDQRVEIKAEFPNVRDAFEIETALTNLADTAYQYAHRKI